MEAESLSPEVYEYLRRVARRYCRAAGGTPTLQPTALVHEAYMRLCSGRQPGWRDRAHFCASAATAMRHVLIDAYRRRVAAKRGAGAEHVTLSDVCTPGESAVVNLMAIDRALARMATLDPRMAQVVQHRIFGGATGDEIAAHLGISLRTVNKDWRRARAWLACELGAAWRFE